MLILGYAIMQLPGFCRSCYLAIRKCLSKKEETKKKKNHQIEIQETPLKQLITKIEDHVGKTENRNSKDILKTI